MNCLRLITLIQLVLKTEAKVACIRAGSLVPGPFLPCGAGRRRHRLPFWQEGHQGHDNNLDFLRNIALPITPLSSYSDTFCVIVLLEVRKFSLLNLTFRVSRQTLLVPHHHEILLPTPKPLPLTATLLDARQFTN